MTEGEEHLPTIKQELVKMVEAEGSVTYDTKSNSTEIDTNISKKTRVSGLYLFILIIEYLKIIIIIFFFHITKILFLIYYLLFV